MNIQKVTVKALFMKDDSVFFVKDKKGNWELPGGCIEFGEKPHDALRRELKEELNLDDVGVERVVDVFDIQQVQDDGNCYQYIVIVFKCNADLSSIVLSDEHEESAWLGLQAEDKYPMKVGYRVLMHNCLQER